MTMDVGSWLRSLGLGQYEANFRDNKIDADLLPRLTDAGLKDIGVSALGDRLRLLDAIAALASAKPLANSAVSPPKAAALKGREQSAERRPITVMFCDLVGSTKRVKILNARLRCSNPAGATSAPGKHRAAKSAKTHGRKPIAAIPRAPGIAAG